MLNIDQLESLPLKLQDKYLVYSLFCIPFSYYQ